MKFLTGLFRQRLVLSSYDAVQIATVRMALQEAASSSKCASIQTI